MNVVGRKKEIQLLKKKLNSKKSEFIAVYGRRRVGKTYLIRNLFKEEMIFDLSGLADANLQEQLFNFHLSQKTFSHKPLNKPENWLEAFENLKSIIEQSQQKKKVIFIDELPWLDTPRSGFITALEHFWNSWAVNRTDLMLIVCGSAASWMINELINNKRGLHNRITQKIQLHPFELSECKEFLRYKNIDLDDYQIIQLYMVLGGVPYYWEAIEKGQSAHQVIDAVCFNENGLLTYEFDNLFQSLFSKAKRHESIVKAIATKNKGLTREEIVTHTKLSNGGTLTDILFELEKSGFIRRYNAFGKKSRDSLYQLSDFFSLFHLKFIEPKKGEKDNWTKMIDHPKYRAWSGYAFEQVCLAHTHKIKDALGISGVQTETAAWKSEPTKNGAQIDLVIDRRDHIINLCEMKFSMSTFNIDRKYDEVLRHKKALFKEETKTKKALHTTMITTFGLRENQYSGNVANDFKMDVLFT